MLHHSGSKSRLQIIEKSILLLFKLVFFCILSDGFRKWGFKRFFANLLSESWLESESRFLIKGSSLLALPQKSPKESIHPESIPGLIPVLVLTKIEKANRRVCSALLSDDLLDYTWIWSEMQGGSYDLKN
jgi:hypothetical protein